MNALGKFIQSRNLTPVQNQRLLAYLGKSPSAWRSMFNQSRRFTGNGDELHTDLVHALNLDKVDAAILRVAIDRNVTSYTVNTSNWPDHRLRPAAYHLIRLMPQLTDDDWEAIMQFIRQRLRGKPE